MFHECVDGFLVKRRRQGHFNFEGLDCRRKPFGVHQEPPEKIQTCIMPNTEPEGSKGWKSTQINAGAVGVEMFMDVGICYTMLSVK